MKLHDEIKIGIWEQVQKKYFDKSGMLIKFECWYKKSKFVQIINKYQNDQSIKSYKKQTWADFNLESPRLMNFMKQPTQNDES